MMTMIMLSIIKTLTATLSIINIKMPYTTIGYGGFYHATRS